MDEFDKIKELSEDIVGHKEPSFSEDSDDSEDNPFAGELDRMPPLSDMTEPERSQKWRLWGLGIAGFVLVAVAGGIAFWGSADGEEQIPVIAPTPDPVRVKPENPGGMIIPDQDKMIYNRLTAKETPTKVENLFPDPEKPVLPEILIKQNTPEPTFIEEKDIPAVNPLDAEAKEADAEPKDASAASTETLTLPKENVPSEAEVKKTVQPMAEKNPPKKEIHETWRVQLFSTSKKATAEKVWANISKKQKALLSDMSHDIVTAEIPGKGTFYRVQAGQFPNKEMALALCSKLKAKKQDCVPVKDK